MTSSTPPTANRVMELPVRGMDCAECTQHVQRALASVPGVESVEVFLTSEKAVLRLAPFEVPMDTLRKAVESTGYMDAAHMALMRDDWGLVPDVFAIAHRTMRVVKMNIVFTALYNLVGLSLAAFGVLPPILAAAAQSLPDLSILANSSRLLRQPRRKTQAASSRDLPVTTRTGEVADAAAS